MADLWYPAGIQDPAPTAGWSTFTDAGEPKFLLHTTEGGLGAYAPDPTTGSGRTYFGQTGVWPNYTLAITGGRWRVYNHIPANFASEGLLNAPGGVQTNRDNVNQVEIATTSAAIGSLPGAAMDELAKLLAWQHQVRGVPISSSVRWVAYPASAGFAASQRLTPSAWDAYAGVLGHEHCPENDHGDPGAFPIQTLLAKTNDLVSGDDVTEQDKNDIANAVIALLRNQVFSVSPPIKQGSAGGVIGATYNKVGDMQGKIETITGQLAGLSTASSDIDSRAGDIQNRIDFVYDQLAHIAAANSVTLDPPPWRTS